MIGIALSFLIEPWEEIPSLCNATLSSPVIFNSSCQFEFMQETKVDLQNGMINIQYLPLDIVSCSRFWLRAKNLTLQNTNIYVNATIQKSELCATEYFGLFDTQYENDIMLVNITIAGNVYIEEGAKVAVGSIFCIFGTNLNIESVDYTIPARKNGDPPMRLGKVTEERLNVLYYNVKFELLKEYLVTDTNSAYSIDTVYTPAEVSEQTAEEQLLTYEQLAEFEFPYEHMQFEKTDEFTTNSLSSIAAFTVYKGTDMEQLGMRPEELEKVEKTDPQIRGYHELIAVFEDAQSVANYSLYANCIDAQVYGIQQPLNLINESYYLYDGYACYGCQCIFCDNYLVSKLSFDQFYCADACPEYSYEEMHTCMEKCQYEMKEIKNSQCISAKCETHEIFNYSNQACISNSATPENLYYNDINNQLFKPFDLSDSEFRARCPAVLATECYKQCPFGYEVVVSLASDIRYENSCEMKKNTFELEYSESCGGNDYVVNGRCQIECMPGQVIENNECRNHCEFGSAVNGTCQLERVSDKIFENGYNLYHCGYGLVEYFGLCLTQCPELTIESSGFCIGCDENMGYKNNKCYEQGHPQCNYLQHEKGLRRCVDECSQAYQLFGINCIEIDMSQGVVSHENIPDNESDYVLLNEVFNISSNLSNRLINIVGFEELEDCNFAAIDMMENTQLKDSFIYINTTINSECNNINLTLFNNMADLENVSVYGHIYYDTLGDLEDVLVNIARVNNSYEEIPYSIQLHESENEYLLLQNKEMWNNEHLQFAQYMEATPFGVLYMHTKDELQRVSNSLQIQELFVNQIQFITNDGYCSYTSQQKVPYVVGQKHSQCNSGFYQLRCLDGHCECVSISAVSLSYGKLAVSVCVHDTYQYLGECLDRCPFGYKPVNEKCIIDNSVLLDYYMYEFAISSYQHNKQLSYQFEQCFANLVSHKSMCESTCPYGFVRNAGSYVCADHCSEQLVNQNGTCTDKCGLTQFELGGECTYDCAFQNVSGKCIEACEFPYTEDCQLCNNSFYDYQSKKCNEACEKISVLIDGILVCCDPQADEFCRNAVGVGGLYAIPNLQDGLIDDYDCIMMNHSTIWDGQFCEANSSNRILYEKEIINIFDFNYIEFYDSANSKTLYGTVLDISGIEVKNVLFNVQIEKHISKHYAQGIFSVINDVNNARLSGVFITGLIKITGNVDKMTVSNIISVDAISQITLYSNLQFNENLVSDHSSGQDIDFLFNKVSVMLNGKQKLISYVSSSSYQEELRSYYYTMAMVHNGYYKIGENQSYTSSKPIGFDGVNMIYCRDGELFDEESMTCVSGCKPQQILIGSTCINSEAPDMEEVEYFVDCPEFMGISPKDKECHFCSANEYLQGGVCVDRCDDGMVLFNNTCLNSCPPGYSLINGECWHGGMELYDEEGILVKACRPGFVISGKQCVQMCGSGYYEYNGNCYVYCEENQLSYVDICVEGNACDDGYFLFQHEKHRFCVETCPDGYWEINGQCLENNDQECMGQMDFLSTINKRCIECFSKSELSQSQECSTCNMINRTTDKDLSVQYCTKCSQYFYADEEFGSEIKMCTSECPPSKHFLSEQEYKEYKNLAYPLFDEVQQAVICMSSCGSSLFNHELTNENECYGECSGLTSKYYETSRCLRYCGNYPNENPVDLGNGSCGMRCPTELPYRIPDGHNGYICGGDCPALYRFAITEDENYICSNECNLYKEDVEKQFERCTPECSANAVANDATKQCVPMCSNDNLYGNSESYLAKSESSSKCARNCTFYKYYEKSDHHVTFECQADCNRSFADKYGRRVCVDSCQEYTLLNQNNTFSCVTYCPYGMFVENGICVTKCSTEYARVERIEEEEEVWLSYVCIDEAECSEESTEQIVIYGINMTLCGKCFSDSTQEQYYSKESKCVNECDSYYDENYNCLENCPTVINGEPAFLAGGSSKLCVAGCIRDKTNANVCKEQQNCDPTTSFISEQDRLLCISEASGLSDCDSNTFIYNLSDASNIYKQCITDTSICNLVISEPSGAKICVPFCGKGEYQEQPYYIQNYGCVKDCLQFAHFYPTRKYEDYDMCLSVEECSRLSEYVVNTTSFNGYCSKDNKQCQKFYKVISTNDAEVHECLSNCTIQLPNEEGPAIECVDGIPDTMQSYYLQYNYIASAFDLVAACGPGHALNAKDRICELVCPFGAYEYVNGSCIRAEECSNLTALSEKYGSFVCVLLADNYYFYYDGLRYVAEPDTSRPLIAGSREYRVVQCPANYYYYRGACTTLCANSTPSDCRDLYSYGNVVYNNQNVRDIMCPAYLVAQRVGAYLLYNCEQLTSESGLIFVHHSGALKIALPRETGIFCAIDDLTVPYEYYQYRSICKSASETQVYQRIFANLSIVKQVGGISSTRYSLLFNSTYNMFEVRFSACEGQYTEINHICYKNCPVGSILAGDQCITQEEKGGTVPIYFNDDTTNIDHNRCYEVIDGQCILYRCPSLLVADKSVSLLYNNQICIEGCVSDNMISCLDTTKYEIFNSDSYAAQGKSECRTLIAHTTNESIVYECSHLSECPQGYVMIGDSYCLDYTLFKNNKVILLNPGRLPSDISELFTQDPLECEVYRRQELEYYLDGSTLFLIAKICVVDTVDIQDCKMMQYDISLRMFNCTSECSIGNSDYLYQGICFATCNMSSYLVDGVCQKVAVESCDGYINDGKCVSLDHSLLYQRSGQLLFEISESRAALKIKDENEYQPFLCPKTYYYYRNACFRKCPIENEYECSNVIKNFNIVLEEIDVELEYQKSFFFDYGHEITAVEFHEYKDQCDDSQLSFGKNCIEFSIIESERNTIDLETCILFIDNTTLFSGKISDYCDSQICTEFVDVNVASFSIKVCASSTTEVICQQGYYEFDVVSGRFKCVSQCDFGFVEEDNFCYPKCQEGYAFISTSCVLISQICDSCVEYVVFNNSHYKLAGSVLKYEIAEEEGKTEFSEILCPDEYNYFQSRCYFSCPKASVQISQYLTTSICDSACSIYSSAGNCLSECASFKYLQMNPIQENVFYLCQDYKCSSDEFELFHQDAESNPILCMDKVLSNKYPSRPENKVFLYTQLSNVFSNLFVDGSQCRIFFRSQYDSHIYICADEERNKPPSVTSQIIYNAPMKMFQYSICSSTDYNYDGICYPKLDNEQVFVLNDTLLVAYQAANNGIYNLSDLSDEEVLFQGNCKYYEFFNTTTQKCELLPKQPSCDFTYVRTATLVDHHYAGDSIYLLTDEEYSADFRFIDEESCQVVSATCPGNLNYHYFQETCVKVCPQPSSDTLNTNCLDLVQVNAYDVEMLNNVVQYQNQKYVPIPSTTNVAIALIQRLKQYIIYIDITSTFSQYEFDEATYVKMNYDEVEVYLEKQLAEQNFNSQCVLTYNFDSILQSSLCSYECQIYVQLERMYFCMFGMNSNEEYYYHEECKSYEYSYELNMYECFPYDVCSANGRICEVDCTESFINAPFVGCFPKQCNGGSVLEQRTGKCIIVPDVQPCPTYYEVFQGYGVEIPGCPVEFRSQSSCRCETQIPCIERQILHHEVCVDRYTCQHVKIEKDPLYSCEDGPGASAEAGQLLIANSMEKYYVIIRNPANNSIILIIVCTLAALLGVSAIFLLLSVRFYRALRTNHALRKQKKDLKLGYHDRLAQYLQDGRKTTSRVRNKRSISTPQYEYVNATMRDYHLQKGGPSARRRVEMQPVAEAPVQLHLSAKNEPIIAPQLGSASGVDGGSTERPSKPKMTSKADQLRLLRERRSQNLASDE